ncbi:MAG: type II toxin-antitoxin system VapC family toxin [Candidatus Marsarchaeota archaeon]|jgi:predicted nucleic acid-binding protein|nr:type II toxin-antitoxin system VapC family toxin [Candidatus Marsarchaeota archaeon]
MIVLDASAIVKLIIEESDSDFARETIELEAKKGEPIYAPDIALAEIINVIWKYSNLRGRKNVDPNKTLSDLMFIWNKITVVNTEALASTAMKIALENNITIYDALYAALSKLNRAPLLTFDKFLKSKAGKIGIELAIA